MTAVRNSKQQRKSTLLRKILIEYCLTFAGAYEDYPFDDSTTAMRHGGNRRIFALFLNHDGRELLNLKSEPFTALFWRNEFSSVIPGYHMNKVHWNSVILDGTVPDEVIKEMIAESHELTKPKIRKRKIPQDLDKDRDNAW
ncbi:MAG: MmcQ/YjbR family DNA-binding protein [Desulfovibrio sp.]|nr:MmcQ/YjbR family DNA-binding protein [Desulfovibrio sp.]